MNALQPLQPVRIEDTEAYDDLCRLLSAGEMEGHEFQRRVTELAHELNKGESHVS